MGIDQIAPGESIMRIRYWTEPWQTPTFKGAKRLWVSEGVWEKVVLLEDGEPGRVTSRKPNDRKNRKSCPLGQMLPSGRRRTVAGPSELNNCILCMDRQISSNAGGGSQIWAHVACLVKLTMRKRSPGPFAWISVYGRKKEIVEI